MSRGVNITTLFDAPSPAQDLADISKLRGMGMRHIRIPIDPMWVLSWPAGGAPDEKLRRLDNAVCTALRGGLAVILDNHSGDLQPRDGADDSKLRRLGAAWDRLAARYAVVSPDRLFFEALNEPAFSDNRRWEPWQRDLLSHIRAQAPDHTVLLTASPDSTPWTLAGLTPVDDKNIVYVFHFYDPLVFTHQGADWSEPKLVSVRGLEYPAKAGNVHAVSGRAAASLEKTLADYLANYRDAQRVRAGIDVAADWARSNHARLIVTEFGVFNDGAPPASRAAWLRDVREKLEQQSIGWTVWEYRGGFGVAPDLAKPCGPGAPVKAALGLCPAEKAR